MSRAERWWRPAPASRRPGQRSRVAGRRQADREIDTAFGTGYEAGRLDEAQRHRDREEHIRRVADAADALRNGDPGPLNALARDHAGEGDDLLDVAQAAGATPPADVDGGLLVDELEAWLRDRECGG